MTYLEQAKATPIEQRPYINYNGVTSRMNDEQYAEYLRMQEEWKDYVPPKSPEERIAELEAENAELRRLGEERDLAIMELGEIVGGVQ